MTFIFQDVEDDNDALKDLNDMIHHETLSKEELKYVNEMIAAIKGGAIRSKKKELKSMRVVGVYSEFQGSIQNSKLKTRIFYFRKYKFYRQHSIFKIQHTEIKKFKSLQNYKFRNSEIQKFQISIIII